MPTEMIADLDIVWPRRGDDDPPVGVGEAYDAHDNWQYTWIRVGPVRIRIKEDHNRATRIVTHLMDDLNKKVKRLGKAPSNGAGAFSDDEPAITRAPVIKQETRGGSRKQTAGATRKK